MPYKDPEKQKEAKRRSYLKHIDVVRARSRAWKKAHPEWRRETDRAYRKKNPELIRAIRLKSNAKNRERILETQRQYRARNLEILNLRRLIEKYDKRWGRLAAIRFLSNQIKREIENGKTTKHKKTTFSKDLARRIMERLSAGPRRRNGAKVRFSFDYGSEGDHLNSASANEGD